MKLKKHSGLKRVSFFTLVLIVSGLFSSCYFENSYSVQPQSVPAVLDLDSASEIEVYQVTIYGPDMDTIRFHQIAKSNILSFNVPPGENRTIVIDGYTNNEKRYTKTISNIQISGTEVQIPVTMSEIVIPFPCPPDSFSVAFDSINNAVLLQWDSCDNAAGFVISRSNKNTVTGWALLDSLPRTVFSYIDTTVTPGDTFLYRVFAYNSSGMVHSDTLSVGIKYFEAPQTPQMVHVIVLSQSTNQIKWHTVKGAGGYIVYRTSDISTVPEFCGITGDTNVYVDNTVTYGNTYYYAVSASNDAGESPQTTLTAVATPTLPSAPQTVFATALSTNSVSVSWNNVTGAAEYYVYYSNIPAGLFTCLDTVSDTLITLNNLSEGTTYYYQVVASNFIGASGYSATATVTTATRPVPDQPTGLTASPLSESSIQLSWNTMPYADQYAVYLCGDNCPQSYYLPLDTVTDTAYVSTGLVASTTYAFEVAALNSSGSSAPCHPVSAVTSAPSVTVPGTPAGVSADTFNTVYIQVLWQMSSGATTYNVYRSTQEAAGYVKIDATAGLSYADTTVLQNTTYYYKISGQNSAGESGQSASVTVTTSEIVSAPTGLTATALSSDSIQLSWASSQNVNGYKIYRATSASGPFVNISSPTSASYYDAGLNSGTTYYYTVSALGVTTESAQCDAVSVTTETVSLPPETPAGLAAEATSKSSISVTYNSVNGAQLYKIYTSTSANGTYTLLSSTSSTSYNHRNLDMQSTHYYKVSASNASGESAQSAAVNATTLREYYEINSNCTRCGRCHPCPDGAISQTSPYYTIDPEACTSCGDCYGRCRNNAIDIITE